MQPLHPLCFWRKICFKSECAQRLFDPECGFSRCSRRDAQGNHVASIKRLGRQVFKARNSATQAHAKLCLLLRVFLEGEVPKEAKMPSSRQIECMSVIRKLLNMFVAPLKKGSASSGLQ